MHTSVYDFILSISLICLTLGLARDIPPLDIGFWVSPLFETILRDYLLAIHIVTLHPYVRPN